MKKYVFLSLSLFFLSAFLNNLYRIFNSDEIIKPFFLKKELEISVAWYAKHVCELLSFSFLMLCICSILKPVRNHLKNSNWLGHNSIYVFTKLWSRLFCTVVWISLFDLLHYIIAFRQLEWFFLIQNALFFLLTSYYIFHAYKK